MEGWWKRETPEKTQRLPPPRNRNRWDSGRDQSGRALSLKGGCPETFETSPNATSGNEPRCHIKDRINFARVHDRLSCRRISLLSHGYCDSRRPACHRSATADETSCLLSILLCRRLADVGPRPRPALGATPVRIGGKNECRHVPFSQLGGVGVELQYRKQHHAYNNSSTFRATFVEIESKSDRLLASHQGEQGFDFQTVHSESSQVGIVPDDASGQRVLSGIFHFPRLFIPAPPLIHFNHPHRLLRPRLPSAVGEGTTADVIQEGDEEGVGEKIGEGENETLRMERRWNARAGEALVPRESPPTSRILLHDSHRRGSNPDRLSARRVTWEVSSTMGSIQHHGDYPVPWEVSSTMGSIQVPWEVYSTMGSIQYHGKYPAPWEVSSTMGSIQVPWEVSSTMGSIQYHVDYPVPWEVSSTMGSIQYHGDYPVPWEVSSTMGSIQHHGDYPVPWEVSSTMGSIQYHGDYPVPWEVSSTMGSIQYHVDYPVPWEVSSTMGSIQHHGKYPVPWEVSSTMGSIQYHGKYPAPRLCNGRCIPREVRLGKVRTAPHSREGNEIAPRVPTYVCNNSVSRAYDICNLSYMHDRTALFSRRLSYRVVLPLVKPDYGLPHCIVAKEVKTAGNPSKMNGVLGEPDYDLPHCIVAKGVTTAGNPSKMNGVLGEPDYDLPHCIVAKGVKTTGNPSKMNGVLGEPDYDLPHCIVAKGVKTAGNPSKMNGVLGEPDYDLPHCIVAKGVKTTGNPSKMNGVLSEIDYDLSHCIVVKGVKTAGNPSKMNGVLGEPDYDLPHCIVAKGVKTTGNPSKMNGVLGGVKTTGNPSKMNGVLGESDYDLPLCIVARGVKTAENPSKMNGVLGGKPAHTEHVFIRISIELLIHFLLKASLHTRRNYNIHGSSWDSIFSHQDVYRYWKEQLHCGRDFHRTASRVSMTPFPTRIAACILVMGCAAVHKCLPLCDSAHLNGTHTNQYNERRRIRAVYSNPPYTMRTAYLGRSTANITGVGSTANRNNGGIVHEMLLKPGLDKGVSEQLREFSLQTSKKKIAFTVGGFVPLDLRLLSSMCVSAMSYVVVMLQFDMGNKPQQSTVKTAN
ncbi:hypothetical protein PR048_027003 [Dryococelus australis]|uniref:Uncharacterized protein n=1 Tax=Dryococelus australis TaxID=614101 RepID=A0ABQ9GMY2_9NEOP|nr:hypothetical protein PR048_027003 [Dryococelus australis]